MDHTRYVRQTMLPEIGEEGQRRLKASTVLIVGLGGLGSVVATYLTGAGVGSLVLADNDVVSLSNLQRQVLYAEREIGQQKALCAQRRLAAQSSDVSFNVVTDGLTDENAERLIVGADVVVDCTDNFATRYLIDDTCAALGKPWVYGSLSAFGGQVAVFNYRSGIRYRDLYPDYNELAERAAASGGVIGPVPGVIGALEALETLKIIVGFGKVLDGRLFTVDLLTLNNDIIEF